MSNNFKREYERWMKNAMSNNNKSPKRQVPQEYFESKSCQEYFSPFTTDEFIEYLLDLHSALFELELKGLEKAYRKGNK